MNIKHKRGFTLVELLVVIAIVGILASIVLVSLQSARAKAKDSHVISAIQQLRVQIETEYTFNYNNSFRASGGVITFGGSDPNYAILFADLHNNTASSTASTTQAAGTTIAAGTQPELIVVYPSGITATGSTINGSIGAYALYGKLSPGNATYFCLDSSGLSLQADLTISPVTITCM
ncbi:MAG: type II secretion system protein [Candidatus Paceibacterota bacterium]